MPARLRLADFLSAEALQQRYQGSKDPLEKTHWQVIWLVSTQRRSVDTAWVCGYSVTWIRKLITRYNEGGPVAMQDRRHENPGAAPPARARRPGRPRAGTRKRPRPRRRALERPQGGHLAQRADRTHGLSGPRLGVLAPARIQPPARPRPRHTGGDPAAPAPEAGLDPLEVRLLELRHLLLSAFAAGQGLGRHKRILLVLDQAGWHGAHELRPPEALELVSLPPCSTELMPVEHVWNPSDEPLAKRVFDSLEELIFRAGGTLSCRPDPDRLAAAGGQ